MRRIVSAIAVLVMLSGVGTAEAKKPVTLLPPDQVSVLANAPGVNDLSVSIGTPISAQEALAAASEPGAQVEVAAGLTPAQAVGLAPVTAKNPLGSVTTLGVPAGGPCWTKDIEAHWGIYPYNQGIKEHRVWCAGSYGGKITYRSSLVRGDTFFCSWDKPYSYKVSGGVGYSWVTVRDGMTFSCQSAVPWITFHYDRWANIASNSRGTISITDASGGLFS